MTCGKCGGVMVGDGYTTHIHCENAENYEDKEPDAEATLCENKVKVNGKVFGQNTLTIRSNL